MAARDRLGHHPVETSCNKQEPMEALWRALQVIEIHWPHPIEIHWSGLTSMEVHWSQLESWNLLASIRWIPLKPIEIHWGPLNPIGTCGYPLKAIHWVRLGSSDTHWNPSTPYHLLKPAHWNQLKPIGAYWNHLKPIAIPLRSIHFNVLRLDGVYGLQVLAMHVKGLPLVPVGCN